MVPLILLPSMELNTTVPQMSGLPPTSALTPHLDGTGKVIIALPPLYVKKFSLIASICSDREMAHRSKSDLLLTDQQLSRTHDHAAASKSNFLVLKNINARRGLVYDIASV